MKRLVGLFWGKERVKKCFWKSGWQDLVDKLSGQIPQESCAEKFNWQFIWQIRWPIWWKKLNLENLLEQSGTQIGCKFGEIIGFTNLVEKLVYYVVPKLGV